MTTQAEHNHTRRQQYDFCQNCGEPRDRPPSKEPYRSEYERDPYCSKVCCEEDQRKDVA